MTSRDIADALSRIAIALESVEVNLDRIERNTAPVHTDAQAILDVHVWYYQRLSIITGNDSLDILQKLKEMRSLLSESQAKMEVLLSP